MNQTTNAIAILYQTKIVEPESISLPSTPVNPKIITIKCIISKLDFAEIFFIFYTKINRQMNKFVFYKTSK